MNAVNHKRGAEAAPHPCKDCGCEECRQECCTLDCLERPRFYCGQVLNDRDLNALTDWVREKSALSRFRHGWGVVCGLGVACGPECGSVTVSTGYAISCCGDDIIVCEPATHDFCCDIPKQQQDCEGDPKKDSGKEKDQRFSQGSYEVLKRDVFAFDLYLQYEGVLSSPQPAISRNACGATSTCEHSRIKESHRLCARTVNDCESEKPWDDAAKDYKDLVETITKPIEYKSLEETQKRLLQLADEWGIHHHCCLKSWICSPPGTEQPASGATGTTWTQWAENVWKWLVLDRLESYFSCECFACEETWGVPLARVWVHRQSGGKCCVLQIVAHPPYRRRLSHECWTARPGYVHLGQYVGQDLEGVGCALFPRGIRVIDEEATFSAGQFANVLLYAPCLTIVTAIWYQDECGVKRVAAFRQGTAIPPRPVIVPRDPGESSAVANAETTVGIPIASIASMKPRDAETLTSKGVTTVQQLAQLPAEKIIELATVEGYKVTKKEVTEWLADAAKLMGEK